MWHQQSETHVEWALKVLASHNDNDALEGLTPGARLASELVRLRTYAKVKPDGHRETWRETVIRWSAYMRYRMHKQINETSTGGRAALHRVAFDIQHAMATEAVFLRHVMPSMRALWAAGDVLDRSDIAAYNCYFSACDTPVVFAEALYILMHGTGVGFSVESEFVDAMPIPAPPSSEDLSSSTHVIEDSTEGWMRAVYDGVAAWYSGANVTFDYSQIRPKGAKLLTKGGEASGPEPLRKYLDALRTTIQSAGREGRRLTTLECHALLCTAGSIVQVGGVRRSAMISFSDRDDDKLRWAKFYPNGDVPEEFSQANNSWVVQAGLTREQFMAEWDILRRSGAGERGLFSPARFDYRGRLIRANPCVTGDTIVLVFDPTHGTFVGLPVKHLVGYQFTAIVDGQAHPSTAGGFWQTHACAPVFRLETVEGFCVRLTANHVMFRATGKPGEYEEVEAGDLRAGDQLRMSFRANMPRLTTFSALVPDGEEPVYDCTIPGVHAFDANGFYVHNCVEIGLASAPANGTWDDGGGQMCNLTSVVLRPSDTEDTAFRKVNLATFIGTMQACLTNFPLLREGTLRLTREDALLGVGLSNQVECPQVAQNERVLAILGLSADNVNTRWAHIFGIAAAAGITCGKPDGNSSVFLGTASGVHAHHSPFYIRRVQVSAQSPVCAVLRAHGVRCIPTRRDDVGLPDDQVSDWTFEIPMKAPEGSLCRKDEKALDTLERIALLNRSWLAYKGHNQSATINVRESEWDEVGSWVFENIERAGGLSFFPYDDHVYRGAPYEEIDEARYNELAAELPEVDWSILAKYETGISEGHGTFACAGGACAIV